MRNINNILFWVLKFLNKIFNLTFNNNNINRIIVQLNLLILKSELFFLKEAVRTLVTNKQNIKIKANGCIFIG